jgi:ribose transport system permease protein
MGSMRQRLLNALSNQGMLVILILLCIFFSLVTFTEHSATGPEGAKQLGHSMAARLEPGARVLIAASTQSGDPEFADELQHQLEKAGLIVVQKVQGGPMQARQALEQLNASQQKLEAIACSQTSVAWLVFTNVASDFPELGKPRVFRPESYRFPIFLNADNLLNIANQISVIAIIAIGMTVVIITGGIDLSVGSLVALSAVLCTVLIRDFAHGQNATPAGVFFCCAIAILACGSIGAFSGLMITRFSIPPFIVTLAMMLVGSGFSYILAKGQSIADVPDSFIWLGRGADIFGMPNAVLLMLILYIVAHVVMTRMTLGRRLYAVGGNSEAARLSGVPVSRVTMIAYVTCGLLSGLGGIIMASQLKSGSPAYGQMYELYVIAAVVVGGTSLSGGEGRMLGTLVGAFTIAVIQNGMNLTNIESYTQKVVLGLVILAAVLLDRLRHRTK